MADALVDRKPDIQREIDAVRADIEKMSAEKIVLDEANQRLADEMQKMTMEYDKIEIDMRYDTKVFIRKKRPMEILLLFYHPGKNLLKLSADRTLPKC